MIEGRSFRVKTTATLMAILLLGIAVSVIAPIIPTAKASPSPSILWGVTGAWPGTLWIMYSEVFTVDTATGVVTMVNDDTSNPLYGDIAMTPNGNLYATGADDLIKAPNNVWALNFNDFYRLDPETGAVLQKWSNVFTDAGFHRANALAAESDNSLLAIEGGGVGLGWGYPSGPRLLRIHLDENGDFVSITSLGHIDAPGATTCLSDGDLDRNPVTGKWYAGFWAPAGSEMLELNLDDPSASTLISQSGIKWQGGFAFDAYGNAYAGSWQEKNLYSVDVIGGGSTFIHDLSAYLAGYIYGLSSATTTIELLEDLKVEIDSVVGDLKKPAEKRKDVLFKKIDVVIRQIENGEYAEAAEKLVVDIREKLDVDGYGDWLTVAHPELIQKIDSILTYLNMDFVELWRKDYSWAPVEKKGYLIYSIVSDAFEARLVVRGLEPSMWYLVTFHAPFVDGSNPFTGSDGLFGVKSWPGWGYVDVALFKTDENGVANVVIPTTSGLTASQLLVGSLGSGSLAPGTYSGVTVAVKYVGAEDDANIPDVGPSGLLMSGGYPTPVPGNDYNIYEWNAIDFTVY